MMRIRWPRRRHDRAPIDLSWLQGRPSTDEILRPPAARMEPPPDTSWVTFDEVGP